MRLSAAIFICALALSACGAPRAPEAESALAQRVQALEDERAIIRAADALDAAVDSKEWAAAHALLADEIDADFSSLGAQPGRISADALIANWRANLHPAKHSFHLRGGEQVTLEGDQATMISNGYAWNALPQRLENNLWEGWGRYTHHFQRTPQGWRIDGLTFQLLYERGDAGVRLESAPIE
ncbi:MAG: nuclear transport factor 2 family protein [Hyphomonadaceae bacterium]